MSSTTIQDQLKEQIKNGQTSAFAANKVAREKVLKVDETIKPVSLSDIKAKVVISVDLQDAKRECSDDISTLLESPEAKTLAITEGRKIFNVSDVGYSGHSQVYYKKDGKVMMGDCGGTADAAFITYDVMRKL